VHGEENQTFGEVHCFDCCGFGDFRSARCLFDGTEEITFIVNRCLHCPFCFRLFIDFRSTNLLLHPHCNLVPLPKRQTRTIHALPSLSRSHKVMNLGHLFLLFHGDLTRGKAKCRDCIGLEWVLGVICQGIARGYGGSECCAV
jgi:hypothetical protein